MILTQKISDIYGDPSILTSVLGVCILSVRKQDISGGGLHIVSPSPDDGTRIGFPIRSSEIGDFCRIALGKCLRLRKSPDTPERDRTVGLAM